MVSESIERKRQGHARGKLTAGPDNLEGMNKRGDQGSAVDLERVWPCPHPFPLSLATRGLACDGLAFAMRRVF